MVGLPRFELGTSCPPDKRATRLRYSPKKLRGGNVDSAFPDFNEKLQEIRPTATASPGRVRRQRLSMEADSAEAPARQRLARD